MSFYPDGSTSGNFEGQQQHDFFGHLARQVVADVKVMRLLSMLVLETAVGGTMAGATLAGMVTMSKAMAGGSGLLSSGFGALP